MTSENISNCSENDNIEYVDIPKHKDKSPFNHFAQQNLKSNAVNPLMQVAENPLAMKMYLLIAQKMDELNALISSRVFFMEYFNTSESSVKRAVKVLKDSGVMQVKQMGKHSSVYILNPEIIWKSNSAKIQYCEFVAKVLMTKTEWSEKNE